MENNKNQNPEPEKAAKQKRFATVNRNITLFKEQTDYLETAAKILGCSQAEIIRRAVDEFRQNHQQELLDHLECEIEHFQFLKEILEKEPAKEFKTSELIEYISENGKLPED